MSDEDHFEELVALTEDALTRRDGESLKDYLNRRQSCIFLHPYTCGNNSNHILWATENGWVCNECDYTQPYNET
jgi:hypothetical protein